MPKLYLCKKPICLILYATTQRSHIVWPLHHSLFFSPCTAASCSAALRMSCLMTLTVPLPNGWCSCGRAVSLVWMCKHSGIGLPCAKSSFAYIWWKEGVMTWSGERPSCSPGVDMAFNASHLLWSCAPSSQALSAERIWQSDQIPRTFHISFLSFFLHLCFSALIN